MPMTVTCACGKRIGVSDALVGKSIRCPKCGEKVPVNAPAPGGKVDVARKKAAVAAKKAAGPAIQINPSLLIGICVVGMLATTAILAVVGPFRVYKQWETMAPDAAGKVDDVVSFALQAYMSTNHMYN